MLAARPAWNPFIDGPAGMDTSPPREPFWATHTGKPQSGTRDTFAGS